MAIRSPPSHRPGCLAWCAALVSVDCSRIRRVDAGVGTPKDSQEWDAKPGIRGKVWLLDCGTGCASLFSRRNDATGDACG
jgi:hypothetical protein